ncbi:LOW QUALITY PROTEIN: coiled-coil domain-containing protein 8 [Glossophaga mutica]
MQATDENPLCLRSLPGWPGKSHVGGWFPWGFLSSPDCLILRSVPDVGRDVDQGFVEALKPVGTFKKIGEVSRREEGATVGMLQIGEDGTIPREVRLVGAVWRVISKPATKEAEFHRLTQFLEEEGRLLEDVACLIEKSTPQHPQKPKEPRVRRRVPQMVTPPPLVVGTYDGSNASDRGFSDFETSRDGGDKGHRGSGRGRKVRKMPVSYVGSKFLRSSLESEDEEELVEAFLRPEKEPSAPPAGRRMNVSVPMFEDNPGPQPIKANREYFSQVSWRKLKRRVKGWAPKSSPGVGEAQQESARVEREGVPGSANRGGDVRNAGDGLVRQPPARRWRPKANWASFKLCRTEDAASTVPGVEAASDHRVEAVDNQRVEATAGQGEGVVHNQRAEAGDDQRVEAVASQRAAARADQRAEAAHHQGAEASAARGAPGAAPGARARKQVKTVRFQTLGRFSWFRKRQRAFWHTPRLPALPKGVPRAGEARSLPVLRAEARAEAERGQQGQEDLL